MNEGAIQTKVPFKIAQRHSTSPLAGLFLQDVRIYDRVMLADEVGRLVSTTRAVWLAENAGKRTNAEKDELYSWWLPSFDVEYGQLTAAVAGYEQENAAIQARATVRT